MKVRKIPVTRPRGSFGFKPTWVVMQQRGYPRWDWERIWYIDRGRRQGIKDYF